jgi:hypothetical protein
MVAQTIEVGAGGLGSGCGSRSLEQKVAQEQPILVFAIQFAHVPAACAVASVFDLFIHEGFKGFGQGDVHRAHYYFLALWKKLARSGLDTFSLN